LGSQEALEIQMAYQAVNRVVAGNTEAGWQKAVVRGLTEQIAPTLKDGQPVDNETAIAPDQSDAISIIQRVSRLSIGELDKTIQELQKVRGFLASEEERMRREMADYVKLTQAAISSTKAMAESIAHFGSVMTGADKKPNI
jgi:hypothetical protein